MSQAAEIQNCHGCKWLDEYKAKGAGYCTEVILSENYKARPSITGTPTEKVRHPWKKRCELYEKGDFKTRFRK